VFLLPLFFAQRSSVYLAASRAQCVLELVNPKPRIRELFELSRLQAGVRVTEDNRGLTPGLTSSGIRNARSIVLVVSPP
jgi:hypothetical protein